MNQLIEFVKKDKTVKDCIIDDLEIHVKNNWFRLVEFGRKNNRIRIYSTHTDIFDVINDFNGKYWLKSRVIEYLENDRT